MAGISGHTTVVGVIGDPVAHSLSPLLHNAAFVELGVDWVSAAFPVATGQAAAALAGMRALGVRGLSVTMPHKDAVAAGVDTRSPTAERLGAVNCVSREGDVLRGENTDGAGFVAALGQGAGFDPRGRRCLVAGAGGAARAVVLALGAAGAGEVVVVNRTPERAATAAALAGAAGRVGEAAEASAMDLVVNATPVGMADTGAVAARPVIDPARLGPAQLAVDLVVHPLVTPWMAAAEGSGARVLGGLGMLVHQAALQIEIWTGLEAPVAAMWSAASRSFGAA